MSKTRDIGFVYKWTNSVNNKYYIGSHKGHVTDGYIGSGLIFRNAVRKYGIKHFKREILYVGIDYRSTEEMILKQHNAASDNLSYNMKNEALGGTFFGDMNGMYNKQHSAKSKVLISAHSCMKTIEGKIKHSIAMTGSGNGMYGKKHTLFSKHKYKDTLKRRNLVWGFLSTPKHHRNIFWHIYNTLRKNGKEVIPRGLKTLEIENFNTVFPPYVRFCNFESRKLKIDYIKTELQWYLKADAYDLSIINHAQLWKGMVNDKGLINSNYGQYIFGELNQFDFVINELIRDKDSRRAVITILQPYHTIADDLKDVPCTYGLSFRIRENKLNMTVKMRSQDSYFGLGSDVPIFSMLHEMLYVMLKEAYPELQYGKYHHFVESFHIYERHFQFLTELNKSATFALVLCPQISCADEVRFLRNLKFENIPDYYLFTKWLTNK